MLLRAVEGPIALAVKYGELVGPETEDIGERIGIHQGDLHVVADPGCIEDRAWCKGEVRRAALIAAKPTLAVGGAEARISILAGLAGAAAVDVGLVTVFDTIGAWRR